MPPRISSLWRKPRETTPSLEFGEHAKSLRFRLATLFGLDASSRFPRPAPDPPVLGLYIAACASGAITGKPDSVATLERRISALRWNFAQRGETFDRADRHVATVLAGVRRTQGRPPAQKTILPEDLKAMIATLDLSDLRGLRDRAILLLGFAGGLRRSEIVGLDCGAKQTQDGTGWTEILDEGILVTLRGKTGWREVEIGPGSRTPTCPSSP